MQIFVFPKMFNYSLKKQVNLFICVYVCTLTGEDVAVQMMIVACQGQKRK